MKLVNPLYINIEWTSSQSKRWSEVVGELCIVPIGSTWVLCLPDLMGGSSSMIPGCLQSLPT